MKRYHHSGQALVEMALVLPLLIMLLIGIVDCARAFHCWSSINHMCIEAGRIASQRLNLKVAPELFGSGTHRDANAVIAAFREYRSPLIRPEDITGPVLTGVSEATTTVTISCTYTFSPWTPGVSNLFGSGPNKSITLHGFATQRKE